MIIFGIFFLIIKKQFNKNCQTSGDNIVNYEIVITLSMKYFSNSMYEIKCEKTEIYLKVNTQVR